MEVLEKDLKVMDSTATAMCRDNHIPLLVFGIEDPENIVRAVKGEKIGTIVSWWDIGDRAKMSHLNVEKCRIIRQKNFISRDI